MKTLIALLLLLLLITSSIYSQEQDKAKHFFAGAGVSAITYTIVYSKTKSVKKAVIYSILSSALIGLGKEIKDETFDTRDLTATILGGVSLTVFIIIPLSTGR